MARNIPNLIKTKNNRFKRCNEPRQKKQRKPHEHIVIKLLKTMIKGKLYKQPEKKDTSHRGTEKKNDSIFLMRNCVGREQWRNIFKVLEENKRNHQSRILYLLEISFQNEGNTQKLKFRTVKANLKRHRK